MENNILTNININIDMDDVKFITQKLRAFNKPTNREIIIKNRVDKLNRDIIARIRPQGAYKRPTQERINTYLIKYRDTLKETNRDVSKSYTKEFNKIMRRKDHTKSTNLIFNLLRNNELKLKDRQVDKLLNRMIEDQLLIKMTNSQGNDLLISPGSDKSKRFFTDLLKNNFVRAINDNNPENYGSDQIDSFDFEQISSIQVEYIGKPDKIRNDNVAFFKYINTTSLYLEHLQIFNKEYCQNANIYERENCFIHTLEMSGIDKSVLNHVKSCFNLDDEYVKSGHSIRKRDIKLVPNVIKQNIRIFEYQKGGNKIYKTDYFQSNITSEQRRILSKDDTNFLLGAVYENHYFTYQNNTIYSKFYIDNYKTIEDAIEQGTITIKQDKSKYDIVKLLQGKYPIYSNKGKISTLLLVKKLLEKNLFVKGDLSKFYEYNKSMDKTYQGYKYCLNDLDRRSIEDREDPVTGPRDKAKQTPKSQRDKTDEGQCRIYYADIESYTNSETTNMHNLALLGFVSSNSDKVEILNEKKFNDIPHLLNTFFSKVTKDLNRKDTVKIYFHNLKYDYNIIEKHLKNISSVCKKDGQIYQVKLYGRCEIQLLDSYKLLPFKLSEFNKNLGLDSSLDKKEAINYKIFSKDNNLTLINPNDYRKGLANKDKKTFDNESKSFRDREDLLDITAYYSNYLKYDCLTLKAGMEKMNKIILEITDNKISIYDKLTISSLTNEYMRINDAYKDICETTGNVRDYIAKAVYGGRVHVNEKYIKKVIDEILADYDGVSQYPSAIKRLCDEFGLAKGEAHRFFINELSRWKEVDYSVLTVRIDKINKFQQMPIIAVQLQSSTDYVNHIKEPLTVIIDKYTLEDYIKLHDIDYEILDGLYFNNGFNKTMGDLINNLFNKRLDYKKQGNTGMSNVLKLMMNSSYGKTIMKKSYDKITIMKGKYESILDEETGLYKDAINQKYINYIHNNYNTIEQVRPINKYLSEVKQSKFDNSGNLSQVGCAILSMSKRIMNEVFDVCNTNDFPIYYTDTDSLHMNYDDVSKFEKKFEEVYDRNIAGKQLGQFHIDFDLENAVGDIYSTKAIFLGKKAYMDVLESKDKDDNIINGIHRRMKGCTKEGLDDLSKKCENGIVELYERLAKGEIFDCILNPFNEDENIEKSMFDFKNEGIYTRKCGDFVRRLKF